MSRKKFQPIVSLPNPLLAHLTLTRIEYSDRVRGGRNIVEETFTRNEVHTGKWTRAAQIGLKMSCIHRLVGHHNWTGIMFGKPCLCPVFAPFVVPKLPIFKALLALRVAKITEHGLKTASLHLFVHPK